MADVTDADFEAEVLQSDIPVLVDFWAPWCGPCKQMIPVIDEIAADFDGQAKVVKMNVDENTETPSQHGVMSIPNFIIFKGGEPVANFVGVKSKEDVAAELNGVINA